MTINEELKPIHISDIEALEKAIIDDVTARRLALLKQTVDACYHKKFMDKAYEWLKEHINEYVCSYGAWIQDEFFNDFKKAMSDGN